MSLSYNFSPPLLKQRERMSHVERPQGKKFSQVYLQRGTPVADSKRMRARIATLFYVLKLDEKCELPDLIQLRQGIKVPSGFDVRLWGKFFDQCELQDIMDCITLIYRNLDGQKAEIWLREIRLILQEENVHYSVDEQGGIHLTIDAEFAGTQAATIGALREPRHAAALMAYNNALKSLDEAPPDSEGAIRHVFEALENVFMLMFPSAARLGQQEIRRYLVPFINECDLADGVAVRIAQKMASSLGEWAEGAQQYRHGSRMEDSPSVPLELAVLIVSSGSSFLRWIAAFDRA